MDPNPESASNLDSVQDEQQLVELAKWDADAMSALYRRHYSAIFGYVARRVGNEQDTHDIVAETFVSMVRYLPRYRWTGAPFRCWLLRIATTQIGRWNRKRRWHRWWRSIDEEPSIASGVDKSEDRRLEEVKRAIGSLNDSMQSVVALYYFEGETVESIAHILNCKIGTVKSRLSRGRDMLREILSKKDEDSVDERNSIGWLPSRIEV